MTIKGYRVGPLLKQTGREVMSDNVLGLAAQTAYYFFLSLFPLMLFLAPMLGVFGNKERTFSMVLDQARTAVPADAFGIVEQVVRDVVLSESAPGVMSVGALLALWAGSNIFSALMDALNTAYGAKETRPYWKRKLIAVACVIGAGGVLLGATITFVAGGAIVDAVGDRIGLGGPARALWTVAPAVLALAALVGIAWVIYYFLPNVKQNRKQVLAGAAVATALWIVATLAFRFYVQNFGSYNKTYGAIASVIVLLTWMYLSMLVLLVGGELNSEIHAGTGAVNPRRGATLYGDRVATSPGRPSTERVERLVARGPE
ncbi:MAG: Ribonuclease BN [uncultured Gemmatimonadaceae bacterium]|uniref:Ribonuclease BN n=1 Tax=uncultured Gemmatimonadaceae bacterium TaxID=246130 RepID=A0A6J4L1Z6_9BACT|nr:MAG: Ribonuclease BN [uncultured Gemmatimonadaceae bacterium]